MSAKTETKTKSPIGGDFDELVIDELRRDHAFRAEYLKRMVSETDPQMLVMSLQRVVEAVGGVGIVAEGTGLNRQNLYRALSGTVSPEYITLSKILNFVGMHFTVEKNKKAVVFSAVRTVSLGSFRRATRVHRAHSVKA